MYLSTFVTRRIAQERMNDVHREAEQERLIRTARGPRRAPRWWLSMLRLSPVCWASSLRNRVDRPQPGGKSPAERCIKWLYHLQGLRSSRLEGARHLRTGASVLQ